MVNTHATHTQGRGKRLVWTYYSVHEEGPPLLDVSTEGPTRTSDRASGRVVPLN